MAAPTSDVASTSKSKSNGMASGGSRGTTYISGGRMLEAPPLTARIHNQLTALYNLGGLYLTTLFSLDPYNAAMNSQFNTRGPGRNTSTVSQGRALGSNSDNRGSSWFGWGSGGGNGGGNGGSGRGGGSGPGGSGGRRMGTVDDVRGPECGSCG